MFIVTPSRFEPVAAENESVFVNCEDNRYFQRCHRLAPEGAVIEWACGLFPSGLLAADSAQQMVAIDIGAHVGTWSLQLGRVFGRVLAFEPNPHVFNVLCANIAAKDLSHVVEPWRLGLSFEKGTLPYYKRAQCGGGNGVVPFASDAGVVATMIRVSTLDHELEDRIEALPRIGLIKIDVEGHELDVLRGAQRTILHHKPKIILESWPASKEAQGIPAIQMRQEMFHFLQHELGYSIHHVHNGETFICDPPA